MSSVEQALPTVSVVILAYNRRDTVAFNLDKVFGALDYPNDRLEVVVADNASTDGTAEMVRERFPQARVLRLEENVGFEAVNRAFAATSGEWALVLDDDCYMEGDSLRRALLTAAREDADLVSFSVDSSEPGQSFTEDYRTGLMMFWACSVLISRRAIDRTGGFDDRLFIWGNEVELTMRLLDAGFKHLHLPDVRSVHMKPLRGITEDFNTRNLRHLAYVAGKLLQPVDAAVAAWNLTMQAALTALRYRGGYARGIPAVWQGFRDGLAVREPVRPAVSRLFRRHFIEFASNVQLWPRIRHLLVHRGRPGTDFRQAFWAARPKLYPRASASLQLR